MNRRTFIWVLLALLIILIVLPFTVYSIEDTELQYETISLQSENPYSQTSSPKIQVITSAVQDSVTGISPTEITSIEQVDFSRDFVIVAFLGTSTSVQNSIASVKQFKSDVWIKAEIQATAAGDIKYSPYQIIKVNKLQMPQTGALDFILLNNLYEEKSRAVQTISTGQ
jgi:hypothetical protein